MAVKVVFLGRLADLAGSAEREVAGPVTWKRLLDCLDSELADMVRGERTRIAVDGALLTDKMALEAADGSEVALLPPVSGG